MTPPSDQLPAIIEPGALTPLPDTHLVPALIAAAGEQAGWRYVEFFTANIRNPHTRRAYARACGRFFAWCEDRGLALTTIRPFDVATYIEGLQQTHSAPGVKQQLAAVRMLFDWLIIGQVVPFNPASAVRGPKHVVKTGVTPVLDGKEWRKLVDAIPTDTVRDLRDRALIATLTYSFARITAALKMKVEDLRPRRQLAAPTARERRQAAHHAVPPCARRGAARLHRRGWHRRGPEELPVPHIARAHRHGPVRPANGPDRCVADDPPARRSGWSSCADRQSYLSRDRDHSVSFQRRCA